MTVAWTQHRFSGGVLALDVANTVVHRCDAARRFDRFDDPAEIARFAAAASVFRAGEIGGRRLSVDDGPRIRPLVLAMREATDAVFRGSVGLDALASPAIPPLLRACADAIDGTQPPASSIRFEAALGISALSLLAVDRFRRIRICPNCGWLFLDASRNASRLWCDMAVCGNRAKARRHYRRRIVREEIGHDHQDR